ncbi:DUF1211 domain-containing protein [Microbacteriaceae bacterium VKM Ac-2855]|nr:DUF1211 domain-containing protein [Microbacteriaceae bacterium VKM Ac-2855]
MAAHPTRTTTERGLDRLVNFTDAAVAIAITFLVLPLVDVTDELGEHGLGELVDEHGGTLLAFLITFAVIGRLWMVHNRVFEWVQDYDGRLVWTNFLWLLSIVVLPFAANLLAYADHERAVYALYIGTMIIASSSTLLMQSILQRTPRLRRADAPVNDEIVGARVTVVLMIFALVVAVLVPAVNLWALLLLFLGGPVESLITRRRGRRTPATTVHTARGLDRLVNFSDATVAIAITILVLPLVEIGPEIAKPGADFGSIVADNNGTILAFALSFVVTAVFWVPHHRVFEMVGDYNAALVWVNLLWLCAVAFFPFATSAVAESDSLATDLLYIGTMVVMSGGLLLVDLVLIARPALRRDAAVPIRVRFAVMPVAILVLAFVLTLLVPHLGLWSLLLLFVERPVAAVLARVRHEG